MLILDTREQIFTIGYNINAHALVARELSIFVGVAGCLDSIHRILLLHLTRRRIL